MIPSVCEVVCSPARRCLQTASAAGLEPAVEPRLAECDFASWAGRTLQEIHAERAEDAVRWMTDPDAAPHGGQSLRALVDRVTGWLDEQRGQDGCLVAITHGGVIKGAVVSALGAPLEAFWRIDASPLAITELHAHGHGDAWTVARVNCRHCPG